MSTNLQDDNLSASAPPIAESSASTTDGAFAWDAPVEPTENQLRIARNLGAEESVLARMVSEGMDRSAYYSIVAAERAENHLAQKYALPFEATGASIESTADENGVTVTLEAQEGPIAGRPFTARVTWRSGEEPTCSENYFTLLRDDEYARYLQGELADSVSSCSADMHVSAHLGSFLYVGDEFDAQTPIAEVARTCAGRLVIAAGPNDAVTEDAYRADLGRILSVAARVNPDISYDAGYLTALDPADEGRAPDGTFAESYLDSTQLERRALVTWRLSGIASHPLPA